MVGCYFAAADCGANHYLGHRQISNHIKIYETVTITRYKCTMQYNAAVLLGGKCTDLKRKIVCAYFVVEFFFFFGWWWWWLGGIIKHVSKHKTWDCHPAHTVMSRQVTVVLRTNVKSQLHHEIDI